MNNGAFGENFPYSNFHDLNMDWIIKIAKDFLDQYTHIQETIENGLDALDEKATNLEALLQAWYDTHSEDIANQLADALEELNDWYTEHQNYLDATLAQNIGAFDAHAEAKAQQTIESIPADYTNLSNTVREQGYENDDLLDMIKYGYTQTPYSPVIDPSYWVNTFADSYVIGMKIPFKMGYIKNINIHRHSIASDNIVLVLITDLDLNILQKLSGTYPGTEIDFPVNTYIDKDFYVFIRCINLEYGFVEQPHIARDWYEGAFNPNYTKKIGEHLDGTWRESQAEFCFNFQVNMMPIEQIAVDCSDFVLNEHRNNTVYQPILDQVALSNLTGVQLTCNSFLYPAGYVKTINFNLTSSNNGGRVLIDIINEDHVILKKAIGNKTTGAGVQSFIIDEYIDEPFHIAFYCPNLGFQTTSANPTNLKYWSGAYESFAYIPEGSVLFETWANESTPIKLDVSVTYDDNKRKEIINYNTRTPLYTLHDAFVQWKLGNKFPIVFIGDSTTDGSTTTNHTPNVIGTDHVDPNTYTSKLQYLLRYETENNTLRIYNAGFSGRATEWFIQNQNEILWNNEYYKDAKMAVICLGINDNPRNDVTIEWYYLCTRQLIKDILAHNVQPVLMTTQAGMEHNTRFSTDQISFARKAYLDIAKEFNLELIDLNTITNKFNVYSSFPILDIIPDSVHYTDGGHKFEGDYLFSQFVPRTITIGNEKVLLGFANEELKTALDYSGFEGHIWKDVKTLSSPVHGFKLKAECEKESSLIIMDFWVFIDATTDRTVKAYCPTPNGQVVHIDSTSYGILTAEQTLTTNLPMGLHHITVMSPASNNVNFYGLSVE